MLHYNKAHTSISAARSKCEVRLSGVALPFPLCLARRPFSRIQRCNTLSWSPALSPTTLSTRLRYTRRGRMARPRRSSLRQRASALPWCVEQLMKQLFRTLSPHHTS